MKEAIQHLITVVAKSHPIATAVGLVMLAAVGISSLGQIFNAEPTPTPLPPVVYQVRVQAANSDMVLPNVEVSFEAAGVVPYRTVTDTNGYAIVELPGSMTGQQGRLVVTLPGYQSQQRFINLNTNTTPEIIFLAPN